MPASVTNRCSFLATPSCNQNRTLRSLVRECSQCEHALFDLRHKPAARGHVRASSWGDANKRSVRRSRGKLAAVTGAVRHGTTTAWLGPLLAHARRGRLDFVVAKHGPPPARGGVRLAYARVGRLARTRRGLALPMRGDPPRFRCGEARGCAPLCRRATCPRGLRGQRRHGCWESRQSQPGRRAGRARPGGQRRGGRGSRPWCGRAGR